MTIEEIIDEVSKTRAALDDAEQEYFSGAATLDQMRMAYLDWQGAERKATEARAALAGVTA